jgi:hypothetical protein
MATHSRSEADRAFRESFEACAIQPAAFTHEAHLRLAYVYLVECGASEAHQRMRQSLLAFLAHHGVPREKYHETLTKAWVLAISHFMDRAPSESFAEFAANSRPLLNSKAMLTHYTPEKLFSPEARAGFVAPDLAAIPQPVRP